MYGKYTLFYDSPKNWGYYVHACTVHQAFPGVGGPGNKAKRKSECLNKLVAYLWQSCMAFA